jgi:glycosyltransferase involved in cell wall biosynthesis
MQTTATVIVLSWNGLAYLGKCLTALSRQSHPAYDVLVVDNGSEDGSPDFVEAHFPSARVIRNPENLGVAAGWNIGLARAQADIIAFANQDLIVKPDWLTQMISQFLTNSQVGVVGVRKECLQAIGTFDEGFFPAYYEDVDICLRARQHGYQVLYTPEAVAFHYESTSLGKGSERHYYHMHKNRLRFLFKYMGARQLVSEFLPGEIENLAWPLTAEELTALRRVYAEWIKPPGGSTELAELGRIIQAQLRRASTEDSWPQRIRKMVEELSARIPPGSAFVLIDDNQIANASGIAQDASWKEFVARRRVVSFLEVDGQYWGPPPDDETATRELERLRRVGARFIVFAWPAFWWLDYYMGLQHHLRSNFRCVLENDRLVAFDLRR